VSGERAPAFVADFDSASAMLRATARYLRGEGFPALGLSRRLEPLAIAVNLLPRPLRRWVYIRGGHDEAIPPEQLAEVRAEAIARWAVEAYPRRRYPAIALGSSNGALVHLCAALGIPWLPQTCLIPVRQRGAGPDEPRRGMALAMEPARALLQANPELQLHHMHDPNQDRLMLQRMTYFRVKQRRLGPTFERFIRDTLAPGGTLLVVDCGLRWPTTRIGDRHFFQFGGFGGIPAAEYLEGSERVAAFLEREGSPLRRWDPPPPDGESPEAEWGFEPALAADVERLARAEGYRVERLAFAEPDELSAPVAELQRRWYAESGQPARRLLVESFILLDPWLAARTRSVAFWTTFSTQPSVESLQCYLSAAAPYPEIVATLFAHGVASIGVAGPEHWCSLFRHAEHGGRLLGTRPQAFPEDFAVFARFHRELAAIPERYPPPSPLPLERALAMLGSLQAEPAAPALAR